MFLYNCALCVLLFITIVKIFIYFFFLFLNCSMSLCCFFGPWLPEIKFFIYSFIHCNQERKARSVFLLICSSDNKTVSSYNLQITVCSKPWENASCHQGYMLPYERQGVLRSFFLISSVTWLVNVIVDAFQPASTTSVIRRQCTVLYLLTACACAAVARDATENNDSSLVQVRMEVLN